MSVRRVEWNPARVEVGRVAATAERGDELAVFGDGGATLLRAGASQTGGVCRADFRAAGALPAADGEGDWIVALDGEGALHRLLADGRCPPVSDRFGLAGARVRAFASLGGRAAAFLIEGESKAELAISDGARVTRYPLEDSSRDRVGRSSFLAFAGAAGRVAIALPGAVVTVGADGRARRHPLAGAIAVAVDGSGRLLAATPTALYREDARGALALVHRSPRGRLRALACASRCWLLDGSELGLVDGDRALLTAGARLDGETALAASPSGDAWLLGGGALTRFAVDAAATPRAAWEQRIAPVFARSCGACHLPSGSAGVDLSTPESWESRRPLLRKRVVDDRTMPPRDHPLADDDRQTIAAWLAE